MFLTKVSKQLDKILNDVKLNAIYFGSGAYSHLSTNFNYSEYSILFNHERFDLSENGVDTIVIIGSVNLNHIKMIRYFYDCLQSQEKYIFVIETGKIEGALFEVKNIDDYLPVSGTYKGKVLCLDKVHTLISSVRLV